METQTNFYLYILHSKLHDRFYIGQSNNLNSRLLRHNNGYVKSTKAFLPWDLVYSEVYQTRKEAMARETLLKSFKSKIKIKELVDSSR